MTKQEEIQYYLDSDALNQSFLKKVLANGLSPDGKGHVLTKGSYIDDLLSFGEEYVDEIYCILDKEFPSPMWKTTIEQVYEQNIAWKDAELIQAFRDNNKSKLKDENVLAGFEENKYYYEALVLADGRKLLSNEEKIKANFIVSNFYNHPYVKHMFEYEGEFQMPLYWNYVHTDEDKNTHVLSCKGLLDKLIWDNKEKWVQIVDFKMTKESLYKWPRTLARKYNVPFQLSFYQYGLMQNLEQLGFKNYQVKLPCVVLENFDYPGKPRIYKLTPQDLLHGASGYTRINSQVVTEEVVIEPEAYTKYGWQDAIAKYIKCKDLEDWDLEYHENKGIFDLNAFT